MLSQLVEYDDVLGLVESPSDVLNKQAECITFGVLKGFHGRYRLCFSGHKQ